MGRLTESIKHLIIINVLFFIAPILLKGIDLNNILALHFPENPDFGFWQYLTHMFMHGSPTHLIFNMYGLWAFGTPLEQIWGRNKFLFFYFSAGIGAGLIYTAVNYYQFNTAMDTLISLGGTRDEILGYLDATKMFQNQHLETANRMFHTGAVGASGAIYGILVAFGLLFPNAKLALIFFPVPIAAKYFIPILIASDLFFGVTNYSIGNIAHFAHLGGALIGFIIAWIWKQNQFKRWS